MMCPNCGEAFEGERCPNCGRPTKGANRSAAWVVLISLVLPSAAVGTCNVMMLASDRSELMKNEGGAIAVVITFIAISLFVASLIWFWSLWRN